MKRKPTLKFKSILNTVKGWLTNPTTKLDGWRYTLSDSPLGRWYYWKIEMRFLYPWRCYWNPRHKKLRNSIPRIWADDPELIRIVNFTFVTEFYEDEYLSGRTDWRGSGKQVWGFAKWLEKAYQYITIKRPILEKQLSDAYPEVPEKYKENILDWINEPHSYKERYGEVDRIQKIIDQKDTKLLTEIITKRQFFWT